MSNKKKIMNYPKDKEITNSKAIREEMNDREVVLQEIIKGYSMIIHFDSKNNHFNIDYEYGEVPKNDSAFITLDANCNDEGYPYYEKMKTIKNIIGTGMIDFTIYGEFVHKDTQFLNYIEDIDSGIFYVYDIYLNKNWMCQDDIDYICKNANLPVGPKVAEGKFNEIIVQNQISSNSMVNDNVDHKHSILVKPTLEDFYKNNRVVLLYTNNKYLPKKENSNKKETSSKDLNAKIAKEIIKDNFGEEKRKIIEKEARRKFDFKKEKKDSILSFSTQRTLNLYLTPKIYHKTYLYYKGSTNHKEERKDIEKSIKKELADIFMKQYDFK